MADEKNKLQITPEDVRQTIANGGTQQAAGMTNPNGFQPITPVTGMDGTPRGSAWRNVQMTGNAKTDYRNVMAQQPLAYQNPYYQQTQQTLNNLLGQQPFQYDVNTDALYQQIKDNYMKQGRQAMMDTQGMSAALTGGYGNSYGVLAGQQAYQNSLGDLSAQIPEMYKLAYNRYLNNEQSQRQNLAALQGLDESEYQRYANEAQAYENKIAELYQKSRSGGGGRKNWTLDQYMNYLYGFYGADDDSYNSQSGLKGDAGVDAAVAAGTITKAQGDYLKQGGSALTQHQQQIKDEEAAYQQQLRDQENDELINGK